MATRLKVSKPALLKAIDAALGEAQEESSRVKREIEAWDWREHASQSVASLTKALENPQTTQESFDSLFNKANSKRYRPDHTRRLDRLEYWRQELLDFKQLVEMSAGDEFSVSTGDSFIEGILRASRRAPMPA